MSCTLPQCAKQDRPALRGDLVGVDLIVVDRLSVCSDTRIRDACRKLVEFGVDPKTPLHCFRKGQLAVTVRSIGKGSRLEINGDGIGFIVRRTPRNGHSLTGAKFREIRTQLSGANQRAGEPLTSGKEDRVMRKDLIEDGPFKGLKKGNYYQAMMADPAWYYRPYAPPPADARGRRDTEVHYATSSLADIKALPVAMLAAPDCWLFLWSPSSYLKQAMDVMAAWGFEFSSTGIVWIKTRKHHDGSQVLAESDLRIGLGKTTRKGSEICLLGKRGSPRVLAHDVKEVLLAPIREHSRKPDEAYRRIERFCAGPYLDLFARETHDGWDAWGDEVGKFDFRGLRVRPRDLTHSPT